MLAPPASSLIVTLPWRPSAKALRMAGVVLAVVGVLCRRQAHPQSAIAQYAHGSYYVGTDEVSSAATRQLPQGRVRPN